MDNLLLIVILTFSISLGLGFGIFAGYYVFLKRKVHSLQATSSIIYNTIEQKPSNEKENPIIKPLENPSTNTEDNSIMTVETKAKLIQNLEKFENSESFIQNNISLPFLASYLGTNTKYLSNIIKNYKNKDFNSYINDLRIDYIIRKLNDTREYRHYKISTLAEEAGYSSHSKFATIFKSIVGMSPSLYIQHLEEKDKSVIEN